MGRRTKQRFGLNLYFFLLLFSTTSFSAEDVAKTFKATSLTGKWGGFYLQPTEHRERRLFGEDKILDHENKKVSFFVTLTSKGKIVEGVADEENYKNDDRYKSPRLRSTIKGEWSGEQVKFTKTYDSIPESAEYTGTIDKTLTVIKGTWNISGSSPLHEGHSTDFELIRIK